MRIVKDVSELPELFEMPIEWGIVITDNQILVFKQGADAEEWEGHGENVETLLEQAFPHVTAEERENIFLERIVFMAYAPSKFKVFVPKNANLSTNQRESTLKYLEDMKAEDTMGDIEISFYGEENRGVECSIDCLLDGVKLREPQFTDIDSREMIIGIPIKEYLQSAMQSKPRTQ